MRAGAYAPHTRLDRYFKYVTGYEPKDAQEYVREVENWTMSWRFGPLPVLLHEGMARRDSWTICHSN